MASRSNMETFNTTVARIFELLYDGFPEPTNIGQDHFLDALDSEGNSIGRDGGVIRIQSTLLWLTEEGYIRTRGYSNHICLGAVLTQKGLTILRATPAALEGNGPFGERIKTALAQGSKAVVSKLIEQLLENGFKLAMGSN